MPKIVYLCEYGTIYGGENSMLSGIEPLKRLGFDIAVASPEQSPLANEVAARGVPHYPFRWTDETGRRKPLEELRTELELVIPEWNADLVHANSLSASRVLGPVPRPKNTTFVGHIRDIIKLSGQAVRDVSMLDRIYCVSRATCQFHLLQGLAEERACILHNGVDLRTFSPPPTRPERAPLRLVFLGQLVMRKGIDVLLEAFGRAVHAGADVSLDLYGECHSAKDEAQRYLESLHRYSVEPPLAGRVHFHGRAHAAEEVLREADVLVHPARQEPWGRVLLEAAACALPVITTEVGGTREMFPNGEALMVPSGDAAAFSQAILAVYQSQELRRTLGEKARRRMQEFEISDFAGKLAISYRKLLQQTAK